MATAVRRTNNEVKVEMEEDNNDDTDIEYNEEEIELEENDNDKYLNQQALVPNETFNSKSFFHSSKFFGNFHGQFRFSRTDSCNA